jgi:hypothetical protein
VERCDSRSPGSSRIGRRQVRLAATCAAALGHVTLRFGEDDKPREAIVAPFSLPPRWVGVRSPWFHANRLTGSGRRGAAQPGPPGARHTLSERLRSTEEAQQQRIGAILRDGGEVLQAAVKPRLMGAALGGDGGVV